MKSLFGGPFQMHPLLRKGIADFTAIYHNTRPPNQLRSRAKKPWQQSISAATTTRATWRWDSLCDTNLMADCKNSLVKYYPSETFVSMIFKNKCIKCIPAKVKRPQHWTNKHLINQQDLDAAQDALVHGFVVR